MLTRLKGLIFDISSFLVVITVVLSAISLTRSILRVVATEEKVKAAQAKLEEASRHQKELSEQLKEMQTVSYKEKEARDKLGLAKEGEIVVVMPEDEILRRLSPRSKNEEIRVPEDMNWKKWFNLFFDN